MSIDFDKFVSWAEKRFGDIVVSGDEVKLNSIFREDYKHKMWCNPKGGKNARPLGVYHCWKSEKIGSLPALVMMVDKCSFREALAVLNAEDYVSLEELEEDINDIITSDIKIKPPVPGLLLPSETFHIEEMPKYSNARIMAENYLENRKISIDDFMFCTGGDYKNRILIPYYDRNKTLIYYNCRYIGNKKTDIKYLGPPKSVGVGKADVIYCPNWEFRSDKVYLTEGEFDTYVLYMCGLDAMAFGGKSISDKQASYFKNMKPVIALDNDDAGRGALTDIGDFLLSRGFTNISYVRPPKIYKDWNEMYLKEKPAIIRAYIKTNEKKFTEDTTIQFLF